MSYKIIWAFEWWFIILYAELLPLTVFGIRDFSPTRIQKKPGSESGKSGSGSLKSKTSTNIIRKSYLNFSIWVQIQAGSGSGSGAKLSGTATLTVLCLGVGSVGWGRGWTEVGWDENLRHPPLLPPPVRHRQPPRTPPRLATHSHLGEPQKSFF